MDRPIHTPTTVASHGRMGFHRAAALCLAIALVTTGMGIECVFIPNGLPTGDPPGQDPSTQPTTQPGDPNPPPPPPPGNNAPVVVNQTATGFEDAALTVTLTGADADNDDLTFSIVAQPGHGTLGTLNNTPTNTATVVYTPAANFNGADTFTFKAVDGRGGTSGVATVSLTLAPVNDPPAATNQSLSVVANTPRTLTLSGGDVDGDALTFTVQAQPVHGSLTGTPPNLTYTPTASYVGSDSFTFTASDGLLVSSAATVSLTVAAAPVGNTLFVDKNLSTTSCTNYNPATRTCAAGGAFKAYKTISAASAVALPGDTIEVRAGSYSERLIPSRSGSAGARITYHAHNSEVVSLTGSPAIDLSNRSYVVVDGFTVDNTQWLEASNAHWNIVRNNSFTRTPATGTTGNVRFITSHYNQIVSNLIEDGNDNLILIDSDHNLIEGNTIHKARHALWAIKCGDYNVVRNNTFNNPDQKIGEIYDCADTGAAGIVQSNATKHNLVEGNRFELTSGSGNEKNGIQYSAQQGVIRRNVFESNFGGGLAFAGYGDEASFCNSNRVYHNVFYKNHFGGVNFSTFSGTQGTDNLLKNNVFLQNDDNSGHTAQAVLRKLSGYQFEKNDIFNTAAGQQGVLYYDQGSSNCGAGTLSCWQSNYPSLFVANVEVDPGFVNAPGHDFHLAANSPMVDNGAFLTKASTAGSGTVLTVDDANWFCDGFGIEGLVGDTIQLQGQTATATIVSIDYAARTLTLDRALTWSAGQGVSLAFNGAGPDIGAFER